MDTLSHGQSAFLTMTLPLSSSTIAIPSLDTIPGSAAPTPTAPSPECPPTPPPLPAGDAPPSVASEGGQSAYTVPSEYLTPSEGVASRRTSIAGSYFPSAAAGPSTLACPPVSPSPSGVSTPSRTRPAPLSIPTATPDEPLFSAYPDQGSSTGSNKGKAKGFSFPLKPAFSLAHPIRTARLQRDESSAESSSASRPSTPQKIARSLSRRRRASSYSGSRPDIAPNDQNRSPSQPTKASSLPRTFRSFPGRRSSIHGHETDGGYPAKGSSWPEMPEEVESRFGHRQVPYSYAHPAESEYTLQSVSTIATIRPLSATPLISPRRSSLVSSRSIDTSNRVVLGLTNISAEDNDDHVEIASPEDMVMPHDPPPRRSSLDYGQSLFSMTEVKDQKVAIDTEMPRIIPPDRRSLLSASLTGTDTSASAEFFSEKEHPLSSATTSLSRSAKSGKEGVSDEKDAALSAIRLQRSLEWEARQTRHRRRLEKRRMILLELVETEVGYMDGLSTLVQVYLPQLYALPSVSERTADLIARNAKELLTLHIRLAGKMVEVLKEEKLGYDLGPEPVVSSQLEKVSRRIAGIFVEEVSAFSAYNEYCAGSIAAATIVRSVSMRPEYNSYERRCQIISAARLHPTLPDLLSGSTSEPMPIGAIASAPSSPTTGTPSNRSRLHFRDFLIMPVQRVCRYPLLLNQLLSSATTPSPEEHEHPMYPEDADGDYDTGIDVERALGAMRGVAEDADEARRVKENEIKSATIVERLEPHTALSPPFLKSLGTCRLIGSLDVLHHHPVVAPLVPPVKVKYLAAFLYKGYLILAKVKKGKVYEAKHFLPLEVFELIDITEGFLPHSIRLSLREHNFDLAASCETEKEVWASALCQARDESNIPPFELPASVSPFAARSRRQSTHLSPETLSLSLGPALATKSPTVSLVNQRHSLAMTPSELTFPLPPTRPDEPAYVDSPAVSPSAKTFSFTPDKTGRTGQASTILLRRASATQRLIVDRALIDIFSESCATARSRAQLNHTLFLPDVPQSEIRDGMAIKDSTHLRRRRSFLDARHARQPSFDISFSGEVRGSVMPIRQTRSYAGNKRAHQKKRFTVQENESSTEIDNATAGERATESAEETAVSDFGTLTQGPSGVSRTPSSVSIFRPPSPTRQMSSSAFGSGTFGLAKRKSLTNIRKSIDMASESTTSLANLLTLSRRKTGASGYPTKRPTTPNRTKSMPVSPMSSPHLEQRSQVEPALPLPTSRPLRSSHGSFSVHSSPARRTVNIGNAGGDDEVTVWARGAGYTNQMPGPERTRSWAGLRRSMSFMRDNNSAYSISQTDLAGLTADNTATNAGSTAMLYGGGEDGSGSGSGSGSGGSRPPYSRRTSTDLTAISAISAASASSAGTSDHSVAPDEEDVGGRERDVFGEAFETPRRRRSTRLFSSLRGFTPI